MTPQHATPGSRLHLRPFRAMRYSPEVVGDMAAVTSPPYDMMDRRMIDGLLERHPRNIVRLILPRMVTDPVTSENPYQRAAKRLERWRRRGVLVTDPEPALYVYEYGDDHHSVCGLVGTVELHTPGEQVILPHEGVIAGIVADRLALVTATQSNLEPILLVYSGNGELAPLIGAAREEPPLTDVRAPDGTFHRVWSVTDPSAFAAVDAGLADHQALIADGHHRYAAYLQLRDAVPAAQSGPAASGLALVIDQSECPLQLGAIHRSLSDLALAMLQVPDDRFTLSAAVDLRGQRPRPPEGPGELVITDGVSERRVCLRGPARPAWSDARLLHDLLLPAWEVADDRVGYHHAVEQALRAAREDSGVAVLLHPATVAQVMDVARAGQMMPRKSTSFGPKPRMGLLMRSFSDEQ
jgi:uncharacterized protein (DUF1015 family)